MDKKKTRVYEILQDIDIAALVEVTTSQMNDLTEKLKEYNKTGIYHKKVAGFGDGSAIFYNHDKFELKDILKSPLLLGYNQVLLGLHLKYKHTEESILVVVLHLKANDAHNQEKVRNKQLINLHDYIKEWKDSKKIECPIVICGDFNSSRQPIHKPTYKCMLEHKYTDVFQHINEPTHNSGTILDYVF